LFFPEGTSSDTRRVLPFKSTLFEAFFDPSLSHMAQIQPVTVIYTPPPGEPPRFYGWWGDMEFGGHLLKLLAARRHGAVEVVYHPALRVADFADRKALAAACEAAVRSVHPDGGVTGS
jgi:1-acyl-sn-glycerol-3-phosphate acyltransferase